MITAKQAFDTIVSSIEPLDTVEVPLLESLGLALAEDFVAAEDIPPFDNSAMDGYAIRSDDVGATPAVLDIAGEVPAGTVAPVPLRVGQAMAISTGAKIPEGADAVVQVEWTEAVDPNRVRILRPIPRGHNTRPAGGDVQKGTRVLQRGETIRPQEIGVLASLGKDSVAVHRPARVAVLATGNELAGLNEPLREGQIRNSNSYTLIALLRQCRCEAIDLGIARDEVAHLQDKISEGLKADVLITSGGVSMGKRDLVIEVLKKNGVDIKFAKVNIKPGMPLVFGLRERHYVFALPGNPVSTMVTFLQFVKPALLKLMGHRVTNSRYRLRAILKEEITKQDGKRHFVRGVLDTLNGTLTVRTTGPQSSNVLTSLTKANCVIILPEEKRTFSSGDEVEVELL